MVKIYTCISPGMKYTVRVSDTVNHITETWDVPFQYDELISRLRDDYPGCQFEN